mgnify:CR=1 FL=1
MQKLSCKNICKKPSQLRESKHCTGEFKILDGKAVFDCEVSSSSCSKEEINFLSCSLWDMGIKESCLSCPLDCPENKNEVMLKAKNAKNNIQSILTSLGPMFESSGIDPATIKKAQDVMNSTKNITNNSLELEEAINIANYAKEVLNKALSGKGMDLAEFKKIKEDVEKRYKR